MKNINVYDIEAEDLDELADEHDTSVAEVVEALMDAVRSGDIDIADYL